MDIKLGDTVEIKVSNGQSIELKEPLPDVYSTHRGVVIAIDYDMSLCCVCTKDQTELSVFGFYWHLDRQQLDIVISDTHNKCLSNIEDYINQYFIWKEFKYLRRVETLQPVKLVISGFDGCKCNRCGNFEQYAEPDTSGKFVCWSCQQNPYRGYYLGDD